MSQKQQCQKFKSRPSIFLKMLESTTKLLLKHGLLHPKINFPPLSKNLKNNNPLPSHPKKFNEIKHSYLKNSLFQTQYYCYYVSYKICKPPPIDNNKDTKHNHHSHKSISSLHINTATSPTSLSTLPSIKITAKNSMSFTGLSTPPTSPISENKYQIN